MTAVTDQDRTEHPERSDRPDAEGGSPEAQDAKGGYTYRDDGHEGREGYGDDTGDREGDGGPSRGRPRRPPGTTG
ncbi:hypothetical protein ACR6C2_16395 [Streptomyces sp. INA 01156]